MLTTAVSPFSFHIFADINMYSFKNHHDCGALKQLCINLLAEVRSPTRRRQRSGLS